MCRAAGAVRWGVERACSGAGLRGVVGVRGGGARRWVSCGAGPGAGPALAVTSGLLWRATLELAGRSHRGTLWEPWASGWALELR